jgi:hypothetical protein
MIAGTLEIQLLANIAKLQTDMDSANATVSKAMSGIETSINAAKTAFAALGLTAGVSGIGSFVTSAIEAAAKMKDLSEKTGVTVEDLAGLRTASITSGTSLDTIGNALVKLSKSMVEAQDPTSSAALAYKALGINVYDADGKLKSADKVMKEVATSLTTFKGSVGKTAVQTTILGKSGADLSMALNDLAEQGETNISITNEQAAAADEFQKQWAAAKEEIVGVGRAFVLDFLPSFKAVKDLFIIGLEVGAAYFALFVAAPAVLGLATTGFNAVALALYNGSVAGTGFATSLTASAAATKAAILEVGLLGAAAGVLIAVFAGWKLGEWMRDNFLEAQLAGTAFVEGIMVGWEYVKYAGQLAWAAVSTAFGTVVETIGGGLATMIENFAAGFRAMGLTSMADSLSIVSTEIRKATSSSTDFSTESGKLKTQLDSNIAAVKDITDGMVADSIATFSATGEIKKHEDQVKFDTAAAKENARALADKEKELNKQKQAYERLNTTLDEKIAAMDAETAAGVPLTEMQKLELDFITRIDNGTLKLTIDQQVAIESKIQLAIASEAAAAAYKAENKELEENTKWYGESAAKIEKETRSIEDAIVQQSSHNATLGLTREQLAYLGIERDLESARSLEAQANAKEEQGQYGAVATGLRDQAAALRTLAGLKEQGIHVKAAVDAANEWKKTTDSIANGLTNSLTRAVIEGRDIWLTFRNYMVQTILDGVLKNAIGSVIAEALSGLNSAIASIFGSAVRTAGTSAIGSAGESVAGSAAGSTDGSAISSIVENIGAAGSVGAQVVGGSMSLANGAATIGANVAGTGLDGLLAANGAFGTATGSAATATATGSAAASSTMLESAAAGGPYVVAAVMAAYILNEMLSGGTGIEREFIESGTVPYSGTFGAITIPGQRDAGDTIYQPKTDAAVTYQHQRTNTGLDEYLVLVDGIMVGAGYSMDEALKYIANPVTPPGYASGGDHPGGLRIVGETGWEVEATGPSRIWNQDQIASALRSGGANDSEVAREMAIMNNLLTRILLENRRTADAMNGNGEGPMLVEIDT